MEASAVVLERLWRLQHSQRSGGHYQGGFERGLCPERPPERPDLHQGRCNQWLPRGLTPLCASWAITPSRASTIWLPSSPLAPRSPPPAPPRAPIQRPVRRPCRLRAPPGVRYYSAPARRLPRTPFRTPPGTIIDNANANSRAILDALNQNYIRTLENENQSLKACRLPGWTRTPC